MSNNITIGRIYNTNLEIADAFIEWHRRWVENPEEFSDHFASQTENSNDYGLASSKYLISIIKKNRLESVRK